MADTNKRAITVNWRLIGKHILTILKFLRWPSTLIVIALLLRKVQNPWQVLHVNWELTLSYIDVLAWPFVVLWLLWLVRHNISGLMARLEEFSLPGGSAKFSKAGQTTDSQGKELQDVSPDAAAPSTKTAADFQITDDDTHALLTSYDAAVAYVQIYVNIFGTQLEVLRRLVNYANGLSSDGLIDLFKDHERLSKGEGFNGIVPFMEYLLRNTLVLYDDTTQTYQLTFAGFYFLVFLHKAELLDRAKDW